MVPTSRILAFGLEFVDLSAKLSGTEFVPFKNALAEKGQVKGICVPGCAGYSRKQLDELTAVARVFGAGTLAYLKVLDGELQSPMLKHLGEEKARELASHAKANPGDLLLIDRRLLPRRLRNRWER